MPLFATAPAGVGCFPLPAEPARGQGRQTNGLRSFLPAGKQRVGTRLSLRQHTKVRNPAPHHLRQLRPRCSGTCRSDRLTATLLNSGLQPYTPLCGALHRPSIRQPTLRGKRPVGFAAALPLICRNPPRHRFARGLGGDGRKRLTDLRKTVVQPPASAQHQHKCGRGRHGLRPSAQGQGDSTGVTPGRLPFCRREVARRSPELSLQPCPHLPGRLHLGLAEFAPHHIRPILVPFHNPCLSSHARIFRDNIIRALKSWEDELFSLIPSISAISRCEYSSMQ